MAAVVFITSMLYREEGLTVRKRRARRKDAVINWHFIAPGKADAERLHQEFQWPDAR